LLLGEHECHGDLPLAASPSRTFQNGRAIGLREGFIPRSRPRRLYFNYEDDSATGFVKVPMRGRWNSQTAHEVPLPQKIKKVLTRFSVFR
jgi:hypothetical protein